MRTTQETFSIVICTRNRVADLRETLSSLQKIEVPDGMRGELLLVDNASADDTPAAAQDFRHPALPLRYIHEPRPGKSFALNAALKVSIGDIILCTDDDVRIPNHWIAEMCRPILQGKGHAVAGAVRIAPHLRRDWMTAEHQSWFACTERIEKPEPEEMYGANMAYSREVLSKVPEYDTNLCTGRLGNCEDILFSLQIQAAGFRIAGAFDTTIEHHFRASRLRRENLLRASESLGRSMSYWKYHWDHVVIPHAPLRLIRRQMRLRQWQLRHFTARRACEGIALWEMNQRIMINYLRQHLEERRRPHLYERHGLVKLANAQTGAALRAAPVKFIL